MWLKRSSPAAVDYPAATPDLFPGRVTFFGADVVKLCGTIYVRNYPKAAAGDDIETSRWLYRGFSRYLSSSCVRLERATSRPFLKT